jgi:hypothetical protein
MLLIELFDELPVSKEEIQILETAKMVWSKRKDKIIRKGTKEKGSRSSTKSSDKLMNSSAPQKIVVEGRKDAR